MKTLRAKFALLLVVSVVGVVALITMTVMYLYAPTKELEVDLLARQLVTITRLARDNPDSAALSPVPDAGSPDAQQSELVRAATARLGDPVDVTVTHVPGRVQVRVASVRVAPDRWLLMEIEPADDPELWIWLLAITIGVGAVALFAAHRMSRPLALLEGAAEAVTPDGILPALAEHGPTEVRATAAAINSLAARLKRAMESRMRLVAAAGHDFRTPLTRMRLRAEFVEADEERALWLADIDELERIADSAIALVREETAPASVEAIRLDDFVDDMVAELAEQGFAITLAARDEALVRANRLALARAFRNLFINGATHGVRCTVILATVGTVARVTVRDEGPGIAPDLMDQVFEPFFRADRARRQEIPGAGLGLTISREIVLKYGGDIRIGNGAAGGLVQVVELPLARSAVAAPSRRPALADR